MPLLKFLYWSPYFLPILFIPHAIIHYFKQLVKEGYLLKRRQFFNSLNPKVDQHPPNIVGFFHPYCAAGGGGERVLWQSVKFCLERWEYTVCAIYTGDDLTKEEMVNRVKDRFNISLDVNRIDLVHLKRRAWVEASRYPILTILGQSLGSVLLGYEAIGLLIPDVFIDTMGYSFTYPVVKLLTGIPVVAYVHYPTISKSAEMIASAQSQDLNAVNNATSIVKLIPGLSYLKLVYYKVFAWIYGWTGSFCDQAMLNSSWTLGHISAMWYSTCKVVYPPCDIDSFTSTNSDRTLSIVSLAQFRPEKNHALQLHTLATLFQKHPNLKTEGLKLYVMGSVRNDADQKRVDELMELREELNLTNNVEFVVNASYTEIKKYLSTSLIGLHTMKLEHFGISVVELMCSGLITIANDSGGPQMDIIPPKDSNCYPGGYLATTANEYSELIHHVISLGEDEKSKIRKNAIEWCSKFSNEEYEKGFEQSLSNFLN